MTSTTDSTRPTAFPDVVEAITFEPPRHGVHHRPRQRHYSGPCGVARQAARNRRTSSSRIADLEAALKNRSPEPSSPFDVDLPKIVPPKEPSLN